MAEMIGAKRVIKAMLAALIVAVTASPISATMESSSFKLDGSFTSMKSQNYALSLAIGSVAESNSYRLVSSIWWHSSQPVSVSYRLGDVDGNGVINFNDLVAVLNLILANGYNPRADVSGNGKIDFDDLIGVLNLILAGG